MIKTDLPDMGAHIEAGHRAAYDALVEIVSTLPDGKWAPYKPGTIGVNGFDISPAIDAAVLETIVRLQPEPKRRPWWRLW